MSIRRWCRCEAPTYHGTALCIRVKTQLGERRWHLIRAELERTLRVGHDPRAILYCYYLAYKRRPKLVDHSRLCVELQRDLWKVAMYSAVRTMQNRVPCLSPGVDSSTDQLPQARCSVVDNNARECTDRARGQSVIRAAHPERAGAEWDAVDRQRRPCDSSLESILRRDA